MSLTRITYLDQFHKNSIFSINDAGLSIFLFVDYLEVLNFLRDLEENKIYVVTFNFIPSTLEDLEEDNPSILLGKPILVTKNSNARLISHYLQNKVNKSCNLFNLDDLLIDNSDDKKDISPASIIVRYKEINIF